MKLATKKNPVFLISGLALILGLGIVLSHDSYQQVEAVEDYVQVTTSGEINTTDTYKLGFEYLSATYIYDGTVASSALNFSTTVTSSGDIKLEAATNGYYLKSGTTNYINNTSSTSISLGAKTSDWVFFYVSGSKTLPIANSSNSYRFLGRANSTALTVKAYANSGSFDTYPPVYLYKIVEAEFGTLTSIEVNEPIGAPTTFYVGDPFSSAGLSLTAYDDDTPPNTQQVTSGFTTNYDSFVFTESGEDIVVTVTYQTKTDTYLINVLDIPAATQDLFFTEYVEGSSNNKYIEIFNPFSTSVDLSNYSVRQYNNGSMTVSSTLELSGTLAAFDVYVIGNTSADLAGVTPDLLNGTIMAYNGDDALSIYNEVSDLETDIFGKIGEDPGVYWGSGEYMTAERTLVRKSTITVGDQLGDNYFDPAAEWNSFPTDTGTYLGDAENGGAVLAEYVMDGNDANQCVTKYPIAKNLYLALSVDSAAYFQEGTDAIIVSGRARYLAWALNRGDDEPYAAGWSPAEDVSISHLQDSHLSIMLVTIVCLVSLSAVYLIQLKTRNRNS